jgi:hypothetical protein
MPQTHPLVHSRPFALIVRTDENNKQRFSLREFIQCSQAIWWGWDRCELLCLPSAPRSDEEEVLHGCRVLGIADLSTVVTILTGLEASRRWNTPLAVYRR